MMNLELDRAQIQEVRTRAFGVAITGTIIPTAQPAEAEQIACFNPLILY